MTEREKAQDTELLPCPFCGSHDLMHHMALGAVQCQRCKAAGPESESSPDSEAVETAKWNMRPAPPPDARDETIRKLLDDLAQWDMFNGHIKVADAEYWLGRINAARAALKDAP